MGLIAQAYQAILRSSNNLCRQTTNMIDVMANTDGQPIEPLTPAEEAVWHAPVWVTLAPLGADLLEAHGLSVTEYPVLSSLSEAINQSPRMTELANGASLRAMIETCG
jgi:hypothetical protein